MSNYVYTDVFQNKDATNAVILGSEFHTEFNKIEAAVITKADKASPTFTGTVTSDTSVVLGTSSTANLTVSATASVTNLVTIGAVTFNGFTSTGTANVDNLTATGTVTMTIDGGTY